MLVNAGLSEEHGASEGEEDVLKKLEASFLKGNAQGSEEMHESCDVSGGGGGKGGGDLFSEIHLNEVKQLEVEVKKLERQQETMEAEKNHLLQRLRDAQETTDLVRNEELARNVHLAKLETYLASLLHLQENIDAPTTSVVSITSQRIALNLFGFYILNLITISQTYYKKSTVLIWKLENFNLIQFNGL